MNEIRGKFNPVSSDLQILPGTYMNTPAHIRAGDNEVGSKLFAEQGQTAKIYLFFRLVGCDGGLYKRSPFSNLTEL